MNEFMLFYKSQDQQELVEIQLVSFMSLVSFFVFIEGDKMYAFVHIKPGE